MEVVLSPGRFGDETPDVPFQNEEIREWSHVDRLTGMLERARVETERWQTSNQGAAKSYGKVIDSRERNSADGNVVQRARRQVEIFQSQGRGRSVQVVRASQWSSSRITDASSTNSPTLSVLNKQENNDRGKFVNLSRLETREKCSLNEDAISERLSTLLGTFDYPISSSTVPLRRIDSRYSNRPGIFVKTRKSNSNVNLAISSDEKFFNNAQDNDASLMKNLKKDRDSSLPKLRNDKNANESEEREKKNSSFVEEHDEEQTRSVRSAIHLLPSSKSNTTVVNLFKDAISRKNIDTSDDGALKKNNWPIPESRESREIRKSYLGIVNESRKDDKNDESSMIHGGPLKSQKRVGFSKTEIHFVADSGKINIVETDEKPPPTNKFRRRRRLTGIASNKSLPIVNTRSRETSQVDELIDTNENKSLEIDERMKNDQQQRVHTTTVKLGSEISKNNERGFPDGQYCRIHRENSSSGSHEVSSQGIMLRLENRIYDRLEACTSDLCLTKRDSYLDASTADSDIQASALKSTRLVMNLTKNRKISRIIVESENNSRISNENEEFFDSNAVVTEDGTREHQADDTTRRCLDWDNDNEVKFIMLAADDDEIVMEEGKIDTREFDACPSSRETENIHENNENPLIANEKIEKIDSPKMKMKSSTPILEKTDRSIEDYDVVCTDADNNQVLLKAVTIHEPTIARVENDHFGGKKIIKKKTKNNEKLMKNEATMKKKLQNEHTYVNVFAGSDRAPIYENYKIFDSMNLRKAKIITDPMNEEAKSSSSKISPIDEAKAQISPSYGRSNVSRKIVNSNFSKAKISIDEKSTEIPLSSIVAPIIDKKSRINDNNDKSHDYGKKSLIKLSTSKPAYLSDASKTETRKILQNSPIKRNHVKRQNSILSYDRDSRLSRGISNREKTHNPRNTSTGEPITLATIRKNETRGKPIEVVYQTAVYNMKNEKLTRPQKCKETRGPRYLNELICGAKTKRTSDSKGRTSSTIQHSANKKCITQTVRHWK